MESVQFLGRRLQTKAKTAAQATLTEGVAPNSTAFNYSVITTTPTQYGIFVEISDRLLKAAPIRLLAMLWETGWK